MRSARKPAFTPPAPAAATVEALSHEGRGIARLEGKTVFIDGALAGEKVLFTWLRRRGSFDEGVVDEVLAPAPDRVTPPCEYAGVCGGCSLQHLAPAAQRRHKEAVLLDQLRRSAGIVPAQVLPPVAGPDLGYRRKARLGVKYVRTRERVLVGFREKRSRYIAAIDRCRVLHPAVGERIQPLAELIAGLSVRDAVPQVEVAVGEDTAVLVIRHLQPLAAADRDRLLQFQQAHGVRICLQPGGPDTVQPLTGDAPELRYRLPGHELEFRFGPLDFTQVNFHVNPAMVDRVVECAGAQPGDLVLDLFCGLGNFTLPLARRAREVVGVEGDAALVERARRNAALNGIGNASFVAADLAAPAAADLLRRSFQRVVLDPPRSGARAVLAQLELSATQTLVYVSCNPATLARDAAFLVAERGFSLAQAGIVDMFPHTGHVESIAVFRR